jgi:hypothetical protein
MNARRIAFWILFAVTMAVYGVMVLWSIPRISAAADGLTPFDMRLTGYTFAEAQKFLTALPPEGAAFYLNVQERLDIAYPALLAATLFFAIAALLPRRLGIWRWLIALIAIPGSVFDYLENAAVSTMLVAGHDGLTSQLVETANRWTVLKSVFSTVAMVILLMLIVVWAGGKLRSRFRGEPLAH